MSAIDTPDYQRGVVSAQKLLATVPPNTASVTVGVPPNAESLIVTAPAFAQFSQATCTGVQTGINYAGQQGAPRALDPASATYFFDVSNAVDTQVEVSLGAAIATSWYVYSDAATHVVVDPSARADDWGHRYVIPVAPSVTAGDHPLVELQAAAVAGGGTTTVLPAAAAGQRYRLFRAQLATVTSPVQALLIETPSGSAVLATYAGIPVDLSFLPSGLALPEQAGLEFVLSSGSNTVAHVVYTTETV